MKNFRKLFVILIIIILVLLVLGFFVFLFRVNLENQNDANSSEYQAVFLTNGQVYFGKLSETENTYIVLKDVFYLQANNQLQATSNQTVTQPQTQSPMSLVKLGNELHGPEDAMFINRNQVLFFENLKSDGRVAEAIAAYQENNEK